MKESTLISKVKGDGNEEMRGKFGRILGDFKLGDGDTLTSKLMARRSRCCLQWWQQRFDKIQTNT